MNQRGLELNNRYKIKRRWQANRLLICNYLLVHHIDLSWNTLEPSPDARKASQSRLGLL